MNILAYRGTGSGPYSVNQKMHETELRRCSNAHSTALRDLLTAWQDYAKAHENNCGAPIGQDGVLGDYWADLGFAIKRLLDGETGGWDCGSLAQNITEAIDAQGIPNDGYSVNRDQD